VADRRTDRQNYDSQDRASIAASRGKNRYSELFDPLPRDRSLGREVGLGPGEIVLDGEPDPPPQSDTPIFGPCLLWPNGRPSQLLLSTCNIFWQIIAMEFDLS